MVGVLSNFLLIYFDLLTDSYFQYWNQSLCSLEVCQIWLNFLYLRFFMTNDKACANIVRSQLLIALFWYSIEISCNSRT